jgi:plasmid stabilization system protein ParE
VSYWLHPDAEAELGDAAVYYAEHASRAVAEAFLAEFERVRDLLVENQYRGPHGDDGLRVYHLDRFPYTVVYETSEHSGPQIYAVAHQHREPGYWAERIDA